jgi:radical SAM protein with 4Fe4S-binding SPASM domain
LLKQYKKIIRYNNRPLGRIEVSGGEPLLARNLKSFLLLIQNENIPYRIFSNGILFNKTNINDLKKLGFSRVQISIEGERAVNDQIRGNGNFEQVLRKIKLLFQSGLEITLSTTLSKLNYKNLDFIFKVGSRISHRLFFSRLVPCGGRKSLIPNLLTKEDWLEVMKNLFNKSKIRNKIAFRDPTWIGFFIPRYIAKEQRIISGCAAGFHGLAVDSDGAVYPCRRLPITIGNIFNDDIIKIWNHPIMEDLRNRDKLKGKCKDCAYKWHCGGCRGIAYALKNDYLEEDPQCPW